MPKVGAPFCSPSSTGPIHLLEMVPGRVQQKLVATMGGFPGKPSFCQPPRAMPFHNMPCQR